jgi:hypothetical protein
MSVESPQLHSMADLTCHLFSHPRCEVYCHVGTAFQHLHLVSLPCNKCCWVKHYVCSSSSAGEDLLAVHAQHLLCKCRMQCRCSSSMST